MYPYLWEEVFGYNLPMYDIMITIGLFFMMLYVAWRFEKIDHFSRKETNKLLIFIAISLGAALLTSWLSDGIFHTIHEGESAFGSITFLGGLIGGLVCFVLLMKFGYKAQKDRMPEILNTVIVGVVLAHAFGRIGCFTAGCCYGIPTDSFLGVSFPSGESGGVPVYPTQLFESIFLFAFFFALNKVKSFRNIEFNVYLIGYGIWRFLIEFIRGDDRGEFLTFIQGTYSNYPSPSQYLSILLIGLGIYLMVKSNKRKKGLAE
ncbi:MAG: prolipoprotein diacylglyceryl transferase [Firmicutes bacterium]|nr:prolipoprotein diacylglyceryl transferase [Bacillota bacterium]